MLDISRTLDHFKWRYKNSKVGYLKRLIWGENNLDFKIHKETKAKSESIHEGLRRLPRRINLKPRVIVTYKPIFKRSNLIKESLLNRREEIQRRSFIPHLWINHSLIKPRFKSLVDHMGLEQWKGLSLPNWITKMSWDDQVNKIREIIKSHQKETGGYDDMFGNITDYIYCRSYDENYLFSIEGELLIEDNENSEGLLLRAGY